jgi:glycosyltransferase involved in cell wall biosynthesis
MRIALATPLYPPEIGGPATDSFTLARALTALGHSATVVPFSRVRHLPAGLRHAAYVFLVVWAARGADCIVAFDTVSVGMPARAAAWLMRKRFVVRVPGDYAWEQSVQRFHVHDSIDEFQRKRYGWHAELLRAVQRFVVRTATLVIAPSDYFRGVVTGWGVADERLLRIYLGLTVDATDAVAPADKPEGKILFSVGRFVPWKGFSLLLRLVARLPGWTAVIAGDGPLRGALAAQARAIGVADRVVFTGSLPHADVLGWCAAADAFVLNTSFESFSYQVLEAMLVGAPVITTTAGSLPELITDGTEGILLEPNDLDAFQAALESVARNPELWRARTHAAQARAATFSQEASTAAFISALHTVCG